MTVALVTFDTDAYPIVNDGRAFSEERLATLRGALRTYVTMANRKPKRKRPGIPLPYNPALVIERG